MASTPTPTAANPQIKVSESAGVLDTLAALGRYLVVILAAFPVLLALLKTHDIAGILNYVRSSDGSVLIAAVVGIGTAGWGLAKTFKRGNQVATVAANPKVPDSVASLK